MQATIWIRHVPAFANRSDGPTRGRDMDTPTQPKPAWVAPLVQNDFKPFDQAVREATTDDADDGE